MADPKDVPGGPPYAACKTLADTLVTKKKILDKWQDINTTIKKIVKISIQILYGIVDLVDVIGADLVAAIASSATAMSKNLLSAASNAMQALLEAILKPILEILLGAPTAIFSLVAIPLERAQDRADKEKFYVTRAQQNLNDAVAILNKWLKGIDGTKYYQQMKESLPYIKKALEEAQQMLGQLDTANVSNANAVFDESRYKNLRDNIQKAIEITTPTSKIASITGLGKAVTQNQNQERIDGLKIIEDEYQADIRKIDEEYLAAVNKHSGIDTVLIPNHLSVSSSAHIQEIDRLNLVSRKSALEAKKKNDILQLELTILNTANLKKLDIGKALKSAWDQFSDDMHQVGVYLSDFLKDAKDGYLQYLQCQINTNTVYNIRSKIQFLIKEIISFLRRRGNEAAVVVQGALEASGAMLDTVDSMFESKTKQFEDRSKKTSATAMSVSVATGNVFLLSSDAILNGLITDSLIKLINSDDVLSAGSSDFDNFIAKLDTIPDWDGALNIWAGSPFMSNAVNPYIELIANATTLVAQIPILSFSSDKDDKQTLLNTARDVQDSFRSILNHNDYVNSILRSYVPYQSSSCGQLKKLLSSMGLLDSFATLLSVTVLIDELYTLDASKQDKAPNQKNCRYYYGELFQDEKVAGAATTDKANQAPLAMSASVTSKTESLEYGRLQNKDLLKYGANFMDATSEGLLKNDVELV